MVDFSYKSAEASAHGEEWQATTNQEAPPCELGIAGRLFESCIAFHRLIVDDVKGGHLDKHELTENRRALDLLWLWSDGYGILEGALDKALASSKRLRVEVLSLLCSFGETLSGRLVYHTRIHRETALRTTKLPELLDEAKRIIARSLDGHSASERGMHLDYVYYPEDSVGEILDDLKVYTECLMDLEQLIEWSVPDVEVTEHVAAPDAALAERPGGANRNRDQPLQAERLSNMARCEDHALKESDPTAPSSTGSKSPDSGFGRSPPAV